MLSLKLFIIYQLCFLAAPVQKTALKAGDDTVIGSSPNMHMELDMNFDDTDFAALEKNRVFLHGFLQWFILF